MRTCQNLIDRCRVCAVWSLMAAASGVSVISASALATPYVPTSDSTALERLATKPGDAGRTTPSNRAMRALLARDPKNVDLAVRVAQLYIARSRSESDPRLLGQAQTALGAWWAQDEPPVPVLLLRATIRQSNHDFANARRDLEQAVRREPGNAQAWLTLATVQQVTGDLIRAADSCSKLMPLAPRLVSTSCAAGVDGMRGQAAKAYDALNTAIIESANDRGASVGVRVWALTLQAELAERLARPTDAERLYRASLMLDPSDAYTVAAYADFLIDAGRAGEVMALVPATTRADILLLRRAVAAKVMATVDSAQLAQELGQRFAASRARGDRVHLREEARFALIIKNAPDEALSLARDNWAVQKEPLDARIALEAAIAARQPKAAKEVLEWMDRTKLQGEKLSQLAILAKAP